ncbi:SpoIIE family protein phosphatase [Streptomyces sp. NPDC051907]|uniref:SpoIIE family protein phosphatase n=1 Tax=Streptomyces sp. NPDC051907 TaxID=3155284 RepID=UPI0034482ED6
MTMPERAPSDGPPDGQGDQDAHDGRDDHGGRDDQDGLSAAVADLTAEVAALRGDLARRHLMDLAAGVLVAQLATAPPDAADHLARLAASTGLAEEDLAADIVNAASGAVVAHAPDEPAPDAQTPAETRRARRTQSAAETGGTLGEVTESLLESGLRPLGAEALWMWRRTPTDCLELAGHAGVSGLEASHWRWLPPEASGPLHRALTKGSPDWLPQGPPPGERLPGPAPDAARALLPLRDRGTVTGLALVVWPSPADLDDTVRRTLTGLMDTAERMLDAAPAQGGRPPPVGPLLDLLAHPAMALRADPETGILHVEHLNPAALHSSGGVHGPVGRPLAQVFPAVHADLVRLEQRARAEAAPQHAARLPATRPPAAQQPAGPDPLLDVRVLPAGPGLSVVLWHAATDSGLAVVRVLERLENLASFEDDLVSGESRWTDQAHKIFGLPPDSPAVPLRELAPRLHPDEAGNVDDLLAALAERRVGAHTVVRALRDDGGMRHVRIAAEPLLTGGVLTGITGIYQDVSAQHRTELALTAAFDQLTVAQTQAALRHQVVLQLQRAIVPEVPALEGLPGLQVAARYRPAAQEYRVGGDWYDVLPLPDQRVLLAVGDIAGHGIESAVSMVSLRNALHGLAFTGNSPSRLMAWLNDLTLHTHGNPTATALCGVYDPQDRSLCWASAGHLPPLLLREGRARLLEPPRSILLGALPNAVYSQTLTQLRPGDTLLLYTDGLVERRHAGLDESLTVLRRAAERLTAGGIDEQADQLLTMVTGDTDDDTSLVVVRVS